jgi:Flp pilus assembly protein TadD
MELVTRYRLAQTYLDDGAPLAALETVRPVEAQLAESAAGQLLIARAYFHSAQLGRAEHAFGRLVEMDPTDDFARFALGRTLERQNRPAEAAAHYRIAAALSPRPEYLERLAALTDSRELAA